MDQPCNKQPLSWLDDIEPLKEQIHEIRLKEQVKKELAKG
jgi:hypothetical protein